MAVVYDSKVITDHPVSTRVLWMIVVARIHIVARIHMSWFVARIQMVMIC